MVPCLFLKGMAIYFPAIEQQPVILDFKCLQEVLFKVLSNSTTRRVPVRCLGGHITAWTGKDLLELVPGTAGHVRLI